jgi:hypothetical protein
VCNATRILYELKKEFIIPPADKSFKFCFNNDNYYYYEDDDNNNHDGSSFLGAFAKQLHKAILGSVYVSLYACPYGTVQLHSAQLYEILYCIFLLKTNSSLDNIRQKLQTLT